jgi:8-oxo-dGTP diphosphatase
MNKSVAAIIVVDGKVLVARRPLGGALGGLWEFPGGKLEEGESEAEALVREFDEEFGAALRPLKALGETSFVNKGVERGLVAWLGELAPDARLELREHLASRWLGGGELTALALADSDRKLLPYVLPLLAP